MGKPESGKAEALKLNHGDGGFRVAQGLTPALLRRPYPRLARYALISASRLPPCFATRNMAERGGLIRVAQGLTPALLRRPYPHRKCQRI